MQRWLRNNGLAIAMFGLFAIFLFAHCVTGQHAFNQEQRDHQQPPIGYGAYVRSGDFVESVFENWESEFFQMGGYVLLTVFLFKKGSSESKDPDGDESVDEDPRTAQERPDIPWPVRRGGVALALYEHSLSIAFLLLFAGSFILHALGGARVYSEEQVAHGGDPVSTLAFVRTATFWFQSFQNWQSEFLAVGALVVLSVFLRERGSPESKSVAASYQETGTS